MHLDRDEFRDLGLQFDVDNLLDPQLLEHTIDNSILELSVYPCVNGLPAA